MRSKVKNKHSIFFIVFWLNFHILGSNSQENVTLNPTPSSSLQSPYSPQVVTELLDNLLTNYDKRLRPNFLHWPTLIGVDLRVKGIDINEAEMELSLDLYIRQVWHDSRLAFNLSKINISASDYSQYNESNKNNNNNSAGETKARFGGQNGDVLALSQDFLSKIWTPDTFFRNEKSSFLHVSTSSSPNRFIRLLSNGTVKTSTRITVKTSCQMDFSFYPMDKQVCGLDLGSFGYTTQDIIYFWNGKEENHISVDLNSITLSQMKVKGHQKFHGLTYTNTGEYSVLSFKLLFVRSLKYFLAQTYLPSTVVVFVSYCALWMSRDGSSNLGGARIGLGITSVLTMVTIYLPNNANANLAHANCLKALDVYLGLCFLFVFTTLLQSCFVIYLHASRMKELEMKHRRRKKKQKMDDDF